MTAEMSGTILRPGPILALHSLHVSMGQGLWTYLNTQSVP